MTSSSTLRRPPPARFDAPAFGQEIRARREALGFTTRRMARAVGVSQAYVVALEGSRSSRDSTGPCPTVDVLVRFAHVLGLSSVELLESSLRQAGPHVLLVTDAPTCDDVSLARPLFGEIDLWLSAGSNTTGEQPSDHIGLHPRNDDQYRLEDVTAALQSGLAKAKQEIEDVRLGLVFSESDAMLLSCTEAVLEAEHQWHQMVSRSVWEAGAEPAAAVCVYDLNIVRRMAEPLAATLDLIQSHDDIYFAKDRKTSRGRVAAMRLLQTFRPTDTRADEWRRSCVNHLDRLAVA